MKLKNQTTRYLEIQITFPILTDAMLETNPNYCTLDLPSIKYILCAAGVHIVQRNGVDNHPNTLSTPIASFNKIIKNGCLQFLNFLL